MKHTVRLSSILVWLLCALPTMAAEPNVVIFIADDQGMGDLSCYGHPTLKTPQIDRLAQEGMLFDSAFLTISSCSPTRCSLLTGRYPHNTGAEDLHDPLSLQNVINSPKYTEAINQLRTLLDNWRVETHDRMPDTRREDGWTRDGRPLPHNQPWYDRYIEAQGKNNFEKF